MTTRTGVAESDPVGVMDKKEAGAKGLAHAGQFVEKQIKINKININLEISQSLSISDFILENFLTPSIFHCPPAWAINTHQRTQPNCAQVIALYTPAPSSLQVRTHTQFWTISVPKLRLYLTYIHHLPSNHPHTQSPSVT